MCLWSLPSPSLPPSQVLLTPSWQRCLHCMAYIRRSSLLSSMLCLGPHATSHWVSCALVELFRGWKCTLSLCTAVEQGMRAFCLSSPQPATSVMRSYSWSCKTVFLPHSFLACVRVRSYRKTEAVSSSLTNVRLSCYVQA